MAHLWLNRYPVSHPDHIKDLESMAAIGEFGPQKLPRHKAEEEAHKFYVAGEREKAAGHHMRGMKVAQAHGDTLSAQKHALMYQVHMRALGHNPYDAPPSSVAHHARQPSPHINYEFKPHESDLFAVHDHQAAQRPKKPAGVESVPEVWTSATGVKKALADMLGRVLKKAGEWDRVWTGQSQKHTKTDKQPREVSHAMSPYGTPWWVMYHGTNDRTAGAVSRDGLSNARLFADPESAAKKAFSKAKKHGGNPAVLRVLVHPNSGSFFADWDAYAENPGLVRARHPQDWVTTYKQTGSLVHRHPITPDRIVEMK